MILYALAIGFGAGIGFLVGVAVGSAANAFLSRKLLGLFNKLGI